MKESAVKVMCGPEAPSGLPLTSLREISVRGGKAFSLQLHKHEDSFSFCIVAWVCFQEGRAGKWGIRAFIQIGTLE